jgi:hypothetical protein
MWTLYAMKEFYPNKRERSPESAAVGYKSRVANREHIVPTHALSVCALIERRGLAFPRLPARLRAVWGVITPKPLVSESGPPHTRATMVEYPVKIRRFASPAAVSAGSPSLSHHSPRGTNRGRDFTGHARCEPEERRLKLLTCILEVPASKLGRNTDYPYRRFSRNLSSSGI